MSRTGRKFGVDLLLPRGGGGHSPLNWVGGAQNLTLSQTARRTKIHPVTIYLTKNFHMHTLLQYCTPRIYPVLLLFYSKKIG